MAEKQSRDRYWLVPVSGFDDQVAMAETPAKAKAILFKAAREAGYFQGRDGGSRFFHSVGAPSEITLDEVRSRIGGYKPAGAPDGWELRS